MTTPAPSTLGILQNLRVIPGLRKHYAKTFESLSRKHGPVYGMKVPFKAIVANEPRLIHYVLKQNAKNYLKSELYKPLAPILGNGLVASHGETWKQSRRIIAPEFHADAIERFTEVMIRHTSALCDQWEAKIRAQGPITIDISDAMMGLTLGIVGETFFGDLLGSKSKAIADSLYILLDAAVKKTFALVPVPDSWPTPQNKRVARAQQTLDQLVLEMIRQRRAVLQESATDVLSRLLLARDKETGEALSEKQLIDEVKTLMLAGHETTSLALSWAWYLLARNPGAEQKLRSELDQVLQGRVPTYADVHRLAYTRMTILESIRLYPPIPVFSRQPLVDDEFEGVKILRGVTVQLPAYVTHRDPAYWDRPDDFIPERFETPKNGADRLIYYPFAAGPRACIGEHFAMTEAMVILGALASRFQVRLSDPDRAVESECLTTLRPLGGLKVVVSARLPDNCSQK